MPETPTNPAELRSMFGTNLRILAQDYPSISDLTRQLGVNRTQFNRYLTGESFPRPDVLARICAFFEVDARILLEPIEAIGRNDDSLNHPELTEYVGQGALGVPEELFPSGFYRFSRHSFMLEGEYVVGLVRVFRLGQTTILRGFEPKDALQVQGLPPKIASREYRGLVMRQEDGIAMQIARKGGMTSTFNFVSRENSYQNNFWSGYVARTIRESLDSTRAVRMVYEHLGIDWSAARAAARDSGYCKFDALLPFHQRLLRDGQPFR